VRIESSQDCHELVANSLDGAYGDSADGCPYLGGARFFHDRRDHEINISPNAWENW
jgi:hypothetical protein